MNHLRFNNSQINLFVLVLLFSFSTKQLLAQLSASILRPAKIAALPYNIRFADLNRDNRITHAELKHLIEKYLLNESSKLDNDVVRDVENSILSIIYYKENTNCTILKEGMPRKKFIEAYYLKVLKADPQTTPALSVDTLLSDCIRQTNELQNDAILWNRLEAYNTFLKTDSALNTIHNELASSVHVNGLIDTYYSYAFNQPANNSLIGVNGAGRVFDRYHNKIMLSMVQTKFEYLNKRLKALVDLTYGLGGEIANYGNSGTSLIIKQVYMSFLASKNTNITIGNFSTHIGYEVIEATNNFNYSVSNLFANGPFYHTGIKVEHSFKNNINVMAGVVSGWDKIQDNNSHKTYIAQLSYKIKQNGALSLNYIGGNESPQELSGDSIRSFKQLSDLVFIYGLGKFNIGLNAAYGTNYYDGKKNSWGGLALYLQYFLNEHFALGNRIEFFDDSQKVQYLGAAYIGHTITLQITPIQNLIIKLEYRFDKTSQALYFAGKNNELTPHQSTIGIAVIGKF